MSTVDFIRGSLKQMHNMYDDAIRDLTPEQMRWRGNDSGQPISFVLWHYVRTEDNIIQFVLQRKPTVWMEGGTVRLIDQNRLPFEFRIADCADHRATVAARSLRMRIRPPLATATGAVISSPTFTGIRLARARARRFRF